MAQQKIPTGQPDAPEPSGPEPAEVLNEAEGRIADAEGLLSVLWGAVEPLSELSHFAWTGVYWLEGDELFLGPFVGEPTEHTRIEVGTGVCGRAVAEESDLVIDDVRETDNYLACSASTRSEVVVLIESGGEVLGQIDIDSDQVAAFGEQDRELLERVAQQIAARLEELGAV